MLSDTFGYPYKATIVDQIRQLELDNGYEPLDLRLWTYTELKEYRDHMQEKDRSILAELNGSGY